MPFDLAAVPVPERARLDRESYRGGRRYRAPLGEREESRRRERVGNWGISGGVPFRGCSKFPTMEERFNVLETKVAYHDNDIAELNTVIYRQQQAIDRLEKELTRVSAQLRALGIDGDPEPHQKPPHY